MVLKKTKAKQSKEQNNDLKMQNHTIPYYSKVSGKKAYVVEDEFGLEQMPGCEYLQLVLEDSRLAIYDKFGPSPLVEELWRELMYRRCFRREALLGLGWVMVEDKGGLGRPKHLILAPMDYEMLDPFPVRLTCDGLYEGIRVGPPRYAWDLVQRLDPVVLPSAVKSELSVVESAPVCWAVDLFQTVERDEVSAQLGENPALQDVLYLYADACTKGKVRDHVTLVREGASWSVVEDCDGSPASVMVKMFTELGFVSHPDCVDDDDSAVSLVGGPRPGDDGYCYMRLFADGRAKEVAQLLGRFPTVVALFPYYVDAMRSGSVVDGVNFTQKQIEDFPVCVYHVDDRIDDKVMDAYVNLRQVVIDCVNAGDVDSLPLVGAPLEVDITLEEGEICEDGVIRLGLYPLMDAWPTPGELTRYAAHPGCQAERVRVPNPVDVVASWGLGLSGPGSSSPVRRSLARTRSLQCLEANVVVFVSSCVEETLARKLLLDKGLNREVFLLDEIGGRKFQQAVVLDLYGMPMDSGGRLITSAYDSNLHCGLAMTAHERVLVHCQPWRDKRCLLDIWLDRSTLPITLMEAFL